MFSDRSLEDRIAADHPLRPMRMLVDRALREVGPRFSERYARTGRPSMAPERLLRALLLQIRKVGWVFVFTAAAYNLVRMRNLQAVPT